MITRQAIIDEARTWLGTKWVHQHSHKGIGADCVGLIYGVAINVGVLPNDFRATEEFQKYTGYSRQPDGTLVATLGQFLDPIAKNLVLPGDIYVMRFDQTPQHVGFVSDIGVIHSLVKSRGVVEHRVDSIWNARITGAFRFRGLE